MRCSDKRSQLLSVARQAIQYQQPSGKQGMTLQARQFSAGEAVTGLSFACCKQAVMPRHCVSRMNARNAECRAAGAGIRT